MQIKETGGFQPTKVSPINQIGGMDHKVFGDDTRHTFFEMVTYKGFKRWQKAHKGDSRYAEIIDSIMLIDSLEAVYRAAWSIYWNDADASGAIRILPDDESKQYIGVRGRGECQ